MQTTYEGQKSKRMEADLNKSFQTSVIFFSPEWQKSFVDGRRAAILISGDFRKALTAIR